AGLKFSFDFDNDGVFEVTDSSSAWGLVPPAYRTAPGNHTIRGRVKDKDGGFNDYTTVLTVRDPAPPPAPLSAAFGNGGPVGEGSTGSVAFTGASGGSGGYRYSYDFDNDGTFEIADSAAASATVPASYLADGPASRVVRGRIKDSAGAFTDYTTTITVNNVAPTATFTNTGPADPTDPYVYAYFPGVSEPSPVDAAAGLKFSFDFDNDGVFEVTDSSSAWGL